MSSLVERTDARQYLLQAQGLRNSRTEPIRRLMPTPEEQAGNQLRALGMTELMPQFVHHADKNGAIWTDGYGPWPYPKDLRASLCAENDLDVFRRVLHKLEEQELVENRLSKSFLKGMVENDRAIRRIDEAQKVAPATDREARSLRMAVTLFSFGSPLFDKPPGDYFKLCAATRPLRAVEVMLLLTGLGEYSDQYRFGIDCLDIIANAGIVHFRYEERRLIVTSRPIIRDQFSGVAYAYQDIHVR